MSQVLGLLAVVVGLVVVLAPFVLLARRIRRSGVGARLMEPFDEIYNVGGRKTRQEQQVQEYRAAPRPAADEPAQPDLLTSPLLTDGERS